MSAAGRGRWGWDFPPAGPADAGAFDEPARLAEIMRLRNATVNAIGAAPPADARAWGSARAYQPRIRWGQPKLDLSAGQPWAICRMPVEIGFIIQDGTSH